MNHTVSFFIQLAICAGMAVINYTKANPFSIIAMVLSGGFALYSLVHIAKEK